jgi:phage tail-like protein
VYENVASEDREVSAKIQAISKLASMNGDMVMPDRSVFASYNYLLMAKGAAGAETPLGGFAEASGLSRKLHGIRKFNNITLKRGYVSAQAFSDWLNDVHSTRDVVLMLRDEAGATVASWQLSKARVTKYAGPTLNAKGTDVAIEELELSGEGLVWRPPK